MKVKVLGAFGGSTPDCRMTSFLINGVVALDAGSISSALPVEEQIPIRDVVISHSHMDHTNSLPFLIENVFGRADGAISIYGSQVTIGSIRNHLFNNFTWPDFTRIPNQLLPSVRFVEVAENTPFTIGDLTFTPIEVTHLVHTFGFIVEDATTAFAYIADTGPTERIWEAINAHPKLKAVLCEISFHNDLQAVADISKHFTPQTLEQELQQKLKRKVPVWLYHMKPPSYETIRKEIAALGLPNLELVKQDATYQF